MSNTIDKYIITFSIVNSPYTCYPYMFITENYFSKYIIMCFWSPALKSPAENSIPKNLKIHQCVVIVFENDRSLAKNYQIVSLLSVVSKVFKKLVKNRVFDHLKKYDLFSDFQYGFRFSQATAELLKLVSDRIARAFNRSGVTQGVAQT